MKDNLPSVLYTFCLKGLLTRKLKFCYHLLALKLVQYEILSSVEHKRRYFEAYW